MNNILFKKHDFMFHRNDKNQYIFEFTLKNDKIHLLNIIDFNLFDIVYQLNNDVYDNFYMKKINENESIVCFLIKHFFEDLGYSQKFFLFHIKKTFKENNIIFSLLQFTDDINDNIKEMSKNAELMFI
jgi:hypothetical protein